MRLRAFAITSLLVALSAWVPATLACPFCYTADERQRMAYYGTTLFLTVLPLLLIGALAFWVRRSWRRAARRPPDPDLDGTPTAGREPARSPRAALRPPPAWAAPDGGSH